MEDFFKVGVITSTHGLRGEVKVFPTTDDPGRFRKLKNVWLRCREDQVQLQVQNVKFFKNMVILKFHGFDQISQVETWKGGGLYVERKDAVPLEENEYYIADLIGMEVYTEEGSLLGKLKDVISTGANDVYAVDSEKHGEVLIPAIKQCIMSIDVPAGVMKVHLLPGLIDESMGGRENENM